MLYIPESTCVHVGKKSKNPRLDDSDILTDKKVHRRRRVVKHWLAWPKSSDGYVYVPYEFYTSISNSMSILIFSLTHTILCKPLHISFQTLFLRAKFQHQSRKEVRPNIQVLQVASFTLFVLMLACWLVHV